MAKFDEDTLEDMRECYSIFDRVGDMKVEAERLIDVMRSLGLNPLAEDVNKVIEDSGLKHKRVDFETFCGIHQQFVALETAHKPSLEEMVEALSAFDKTQTGMIPIGEFRHLLTNLGDKMTDEQVEEIYKEHEADGSVPYNQVVKVVLQKV